MVNDLDEYGCWCFFYVGVGRGAGQPVDDFDRICKILADGYVCAISDSEKVGRSCVPWEVDYEPGFGNSKEELWNSCSTLNSENLCEAYSCAVETNFVYSLFELLHQARNSLKMSWKAKLKFAIYGRQSTRHS